MEIIRCTTSKTSRLVVLRRQSRDTRERTVKRKEEKTQGGGCVRRGLRADEIIGICWLVSACMPNKSQSE